MTLMLLAHTAATLMMVGVIWMVQLVHYPLFNRVGTESFRAYEVGHTARITWVVLPLMVTEAGTALGLALAGFAPWAGLGLVALLWALTFFVHVPQHNRLSAGFDAHVHPMLVRSNWLRTLGWSARGLLALAMVAS